MMGQRDKNSYSCFNTQIRPTLKYHVLDTAMRQVLHMPTPCWNLLGLHDHQYRWTIAESVVDSLIHMDIEPDD